MNIKEALYSKLEAHIGSKEDILTWLKGLKEQYNSHEMKLSSIGDIRENVANEVATNILGLQNASKNKVGSQKSWMDNPRYQNTLLINDLISKLEDSNTNEEIDILLAYVVILRNKDPEKDWLNYLVYLLEMLSKKDTLLEEKGAFDLFKTLIREKFRDFMIAPSV